MKIQNRRALLSLNSKKEKPRVSQKTQQGVENWVRAHEIEKGLAPEDSINYNHYDSEEDDPSNW